MRVGDASYPIADISGVWIAGEPFRPHAIGWGITIGGIGFFFLQAGGFDSIWWWSWLVVGLLTIAMGSLPNWNLYITVHGHAQRVLHSVDRTYLLAIKATIERAIELRG